MFNFTIYCLRSIQIQQLCQLPYFVVFFNMWRNSLRVASNNWEWEIVFNCRPFHFTLKTQDTHISPLLEFLKLRLCLADATANIVGQVTQRSEYYTWAYHASASQMPGTWLGRVTKLRLGHGWGWVELSGQVQQWRCPRVQRNTLGMEVRETQSYTAVNGRAGHWAEASVWPPYWLRLMCL